MKPRKSFIQQFVSLGFGSAIYLLVGLIGTPIITRLVDPVSYGDFSIFSVYSSIGYMVCMLGLDQAYVRYYYSNESNYYRGRLLYKCMLPAIVVTTVVGVGIIAITCVSQVKIKHGSVIEASTIAIHMVLLVIGRYSSLSARLENDTGTYSAIGIVQKSLFLLISVALVSTGKTNSYALLVVATLIGTSTANLMGIIRCRNIWFPKKENNNIHISRRELFHYGIPLMFSSGITLLFNALDKLALDRFCSRAEVGIYASAMNLLAVFSIVRSSLNALWIPSAIEQYEKDPDDVTFFQKGHAFIVILMLFFGAGMVMCKDLFVLLLGEEYREAARIFPFLMFEPIMYTISETTVTGLVVKKESSKQIIVAVVACITNFVGNWLLTPLLGPKGAAISTGFSYIMFFALRTVLANRVYYINYHLHKLAVMIVLLVAYAIYTSSHTFSLIQVGFFAMFSLILMLVYFVEFKEAMAYVKQAFAKLKVKE